MHVPEGCLVILRQLLVTLVDPYSYGVGLILITPKFTQPVNPRDAYSAEAQFAFAEPQGAIANFW